MELPSVLSHRICRNSRWLAAIALLMAAITPTAGTAEMVRQLDTTIALEHDDNVTFGGRSRDALSDTVGQLRFDYGQLHALDPDRAWGFSIFLDTRQYVEYSRLGEVELAVGPVWRQRFGRGFFSPRLELALTVAHIESRSDLRTGSRWALAGRLQRRMTDRITGRVGLRYSQRRARDSAVFDQERTRIHLHADYLLRSQRTLYGALAWQTGEFAVTSDPAYAVDVGLGSGAEGEADGAFGGEAEDRFVFGVDAGLASLTIGYNHGFNRWTAIDASIRATRGFVYGGSGYERMELRIAFLHRFNLR